MKLFWTAAFAALLLVGAFAGSTTPSKAGGPAAGEESRSVDITLGTTAYRVRKRQHRIHSRSHKRRAHHRSHKRRAYHRSHKRRAYHRSHKRRAYHRSHTRSRHHYSRRAHGPRYHARRPGYTYRYGGYWYSVAWWVPVRVDSYDSRHLSHSEWCYQQYGRYYHARSNTFFASDGNAYRCLRPSGW